MIELSPVLVEAALAARAELWRRGELRHTLHAGQQKIYDSLKAQTKQVFYLNISRQWGKSRLLLTLASELCLRKPYALVLYVAPFAKDAENIALDLARELFAPAPDFAKPKYVMASKELVFPNGSRIRFIGANNERARFARGVKIDMGIVDEAAEVDDLQYLLFAVMRPMTTHTHGRLLLASTPPRTPGHFSTQLALKCRDKGLGGYAHFTLYDNPLLSPADIAEIEAQYTSTDDTDFRRERLADLTCVDANTAVIPEFAKKRDKIVKLWERPPYFDIYTAMDPGMADRTGVLFAYWDFRKAKLIIESEWLEPRASTPKIAAVIKAEEARLFGDKSIFMRVSDNDLRLVSDLHTEHGLVFGTAMKEPGSSQAGINLIRVWVHEERIIINPRCEQLIQQLTNCTYNSQGTDFDRTDLDGHYDLVAALKYLVRTVVPGRNPYPEYYDRQLPSLLEQFRQSRKRLSAGLNDLSTPFARRVARRHHEQRPITRLRQIIPADPFTKN